MMNQKEWIDYFETINGRKPRPKEMQQAMLNGDFVDESGSLSPLKQEEVLPLPSKIGETPENQAEVSEVNDSQQVPTVLGEKKSKRFKIIVAAIIAVFVLPLPGAGYCLWRYQSGTIPNGTYQLISYRQYDKDEGKLVDAPEVVIYEDYGMELLDFVTVNGNQLKQYSYLVSGSFKIVDYLDYKTGNDLIVNPWTKTLRPTWTATEYEDLVGDLVEENYERQDVSSKEVRAIKDSAVEEYKDSLKTSYSYRIQGNRLTLTIRNRKGELISERRFKRLSKDETKKLNYDYEKGKRAYEEAKDYLND